MERGPPEAVACINSRARVEQEDRCIATVLISGEVQWRPIIFVAHVDVGALLQEELYGCAPASIRCMS